MKNYIKEFTDEYMWDKKEHHTATRILTNLFELLEEHDLEYIDTNKDHVKEILAMQSTVSKATNQCRLKFINSYYKYMYNKQYINKVKKFSSKDCFPDIIVERDPVIMRIPSKENFFQLLENCEEKLRDKIIAGLIYSGISGVSYSELVFRINDIDLINGIITINRRQCLTDTIVRKDIFINRRLLKLIIEYIEINNLQNDDYLITKLKNKSINEIKFLAPKSISSIVSKLFMTLGYNEIFAREVIDLGVMHTILNKTFKNSEQLNFYLLKTNYNAPKTKRYFYLYKSIREHFAVLTRINRNIINNKSCLHDFVQSDDNVYCSKCGHTLTNEQKYWYVLGMNNKKEMNECLY